MLLVLSPDELCIDLAFLFSVSLQLATCYNGHIPLLKLLPITKREYLSITRTMVNPCLKQHGSEKFWAYKNGMIMV